MGDDEETIKAFQLVEFDPSNKKQKRGTIECIPSTWISYNPSTGRCQCKFMPPPYSVENSELLYSLVKGQCPPPECWPSYPISLKGHATTYDDATKRLEVLADKKFAYTEDGTVPEKKSEATKKAYQRIKVKGDKAVAEKLMRVQPINTSGNDNYASNVDSSFETSDTTSFNDNSIELKKKHRKRKNMTETESTDENSNVINKPKKKPTQKSKHKQSSKIRERASFTRRDYVEETPKILSNDVLLSYKSKSRNTTPSTLRSQHASLASQAASSAILASNQDQENELEAANSCRMKAVSDKSKTAPLPQSSNNYKKTEPKVSNRSVPALSKSTKNVLQEYRSDQLNETDCEILRGLRHDVQQLTISFNELKGIVERSALAKDSHGANVQGFATQYKLKLPITTLEDFDVFDEKLKADKKFRQEFASTLHFTFDHNATLPKNITALLKKNISRDVALKFNAVKAGVHKRIFKDTQLCEILLDVLLLKFKEGVQGSMTHLNTKSFYRELGNCLSNAIDWDGHRKSRQTKKTAQSTAIAVAPAVDLSSHSETNTSTDD